MERQKLRRILQWALAAAILLAAVRLAWMLRERQEPAARKNEPKAEAALNPEYYVTPKKLHAYDLKSARQLTQQPVWVKEGYRYTYYPYEGGRVDFKHEAGTLSPIEKLEIKDVVAVPSPGGNGRQLVAVFEKEGKRFALPVGTERGGAYNIYADEIFFIEDPHTLYKFWPSEVWEAIARRELKPGMNELQASFAVGMGVPEPGDQENKTVKYPNGGQPLTVTYRNGKAVEIRPGSQMFFAQGV